MTLKNRPKYLNQLIALKDSELIKVISGMRRCGKSSLMQLFAQYLRDSGVDENRIISMNFESAEYLDISTYEDLIRVINKKVPSKKKSYLLFDEIQMIDQWEKAINSFRVDMNVDIYLTGSNAFMLSGQLATLLSGRYAEISVYPLSFKEYLAFTNTAVDTPIDQAFERYLSYGGLPPVVMQNDNHELAQTVLTGIYNTVFVKDIAQHIQVRNTLMFNDIAAYLADTAGSNISITNIENRLVGAHRKASNETIERYIQALIDAFLFYRVKRFDAKGGKLLQGLEKYYPADLGIRSMLLGFPSANYGFALENLVLGELIARGYQVTIGKLGELEIDFIATPPPNSGETLYIQVSASILDDSTRRRELKAFESLGSDHATKTRPGKKLLLTYDQIGLGMQGDVEVSSIIEWLL